MIYLILSILCSAAIFIIFKSFEKFKVNTFTAIVVNYFIAGITGFAALGESPSFEKVTTAPWLVNSLILGVVFILLFNIMAVTAQKLGASVASIANKMALIIPVVFAVFYYNDAVNSAKIVGVLLALVGVYLSTHKEKVNGKKFDKRLLAIPLVLFLGSGFIDTFLKYNQEVYLNASMFDAKLFPAMTFLTAFIIGIVGMALDKSKRDFSRNTLIGGVILGVINYGSIFFLIQIFNQTDLESSVVFPINNMGVVLTTAAASLILFKEQFSFKNKLGILVSIAALLLIIFSA
ncbi:MAG: EamA family transporter [Vicingaceae bacterium]|jgi:drug/metabolite transporter (DMT)-like permease|tara:strand:- start:940 stop:1812 length:873 start_codon:yes stop_codon:yes gene_type:complete